MVVLALVGVAAAAPQQRPSREAAPAGPPAYGPPPPAYKPAPPPPYKAGPPPKGYKQPEYPPQPYEFQYGVSDAYSGTNFQAIENQNEKGAVVGTYKILALVKCKNVKRFCLKLPNSLRKPIKNFLHFKM